MGHRYELSCNHCGYENVVDFGIGMNAKRSTVISRCLSGEDLKIWQTNYDDQNLEDYLAESQVGYCNTCKTLETVYIVTCKMKNGMTHVLGNQCKTCGKPYERYNEIDKIPCPKCKKDVLKNQVIGHWD